MYTICTLIKLLVRCRESCCIEALCKLFEEKLCVINGHYLLLFFLWLFLNFLNLYALLHPNVIEVFYGVLSEPVDHHCVLLAVLFPVDADTVFTLCLAAKELTTHTVINSCVLVPSCDLVVKVLCNCFNLAILCGWLLCGFLCNLFCLSGWKIMLIRHSVVIFKLIKCAVKSFYASINATFQR